MVDRRRVQLQPTVYKPPKEGFTSEEPLGDDSPNDSVQSSEVSHTVSPDRQYVNPAADGLHSSQFHVSLVFSLVHIYHTVMKQTHLYLPSLHP